MLNYREKQKEYYNKTGPEYSKYFKRYKIKDKKILYPYINLMKSRFKSPRILELGPGSGLSLHYFDEEGFKTTALDFSEKIINVAKKNSPNTKFINSDFLDYNFKDKKYDGICAKSFLHLFSKKDAKLVLTKIKKILAKKSLVYLSIPIFKSSSEEFIKRDDFSNSPIQFRKKWNEKEITNFLKENGFKIFKKSYNNENERSRNWIILILEC